MSVVGLLLSRSAELLQSCDRYGKFILFLIFIYYTIRNTNYIEHLLFFTLIWSSIIVFFFYSSYA